MSSFSIFSVFDAWFVPGFLAEDDIRCIMVTDFVKRKYSFRFDLVWFCHDMVDKSLFFACWVKESPASIPNCQRYSYIVYTEPCLSLLG